MAKKSVLKRILLSILTIVLVVVVVVVGYLGYVIISYSRIADNQQLNVASIESSAKAMVGQEYTIVSQNLGFGAYTADFTFFMDGGKESRAKSKDSVIECINKGATKAQSYNPNFVLFQEVDTDSTRSHHTNQKEMLTDIFANYSSVFAVNYHSAYLMYPILSPHGKSNSGILTLSNFNIDSAIRRSLPISTSFSKFLDLDRCYSVSRVSVENGKELVIYNVHMSAYGGSDEIRSAQMTMLFEDMQKEYEAGNYCVCGGDFNHDFTGSSTQVLNGGMNVDFGWAQPFPETLLSNYPNISRAIDYSSGEQMPTCRNCDVPYVKGNFTIIVDGFLVSSNVNVTYVENVQTDFEYSDHNPVLMKFRLV
ncbi:MAG: endonuclease/exonuclease/phosphatase family protein [Clostridia bacterium]|nr:endonuclease/exonuclease/phosphatase family protein [Clostridia bacterium]